MARAMGNNVTVISYKMAADDCKVCRWSLKARAAFIPLGLSPNSEAMAVLLLAPFLLIPVL